MIKMIESNNFNINNDDEDNNNYSTLIIITNMLKKIMIFNHDYDKSKEKNNETQRVIIKQEWTQSLPGVCEK